GIVHRDVKPENLMIRPDGFVKVLDFGVARQTEDSGSGTTTHTDIRTIPGTFTGTPSYIAPEQIAGSSSGPPADIFSLGIVLYEIAAGRRPFIASSPAATIASILTDEPVPLRRINPGIPRAFDDLVGQMLHKTADRRPTARDVEIELQSSLTAVEASARAAAPRTTVGRDAERAHLVRTYARVKDGRSQIVALAGE